MYITLSLTRITPFQKNLDNKARLDIYFRNMNIQDTFATAIFPIIDAWPEEKKPSTFPAGFPRSSAQLFIFPPLQPPVQEVPTQPESNFLLNFLVPTKILQFFNSLRRS